MNDERSVPPGNSFLNLQSMIAVRKPGPAEFPEKRAIRPEFVRLLRLGNAKSYKMYAFALPPHDPNRPGEHHDGDELSEHTIA